MKTMEEEKVSCWCFKRNIMEISSEYFINIFH